MKKILSKFQGLSMSSCIVWVISILKKQICLKKTVIPPIPNYREKKLIQTVHKILHGHLKYLF